MWCPTLPPCNLCADAELPASSSPLLIQYGKREEASSSASAQTEGGGGGHLQLSYVSLSLATFELDYTVLDPKCATKAIG